MKTLSGMIVASLLGVSAAMCAYKAYAEKNSDELEESIDKLCEAFGIDGSEEEEDDEN